MERSPLCCSVTLLAAISLLAGCGFRTLKRAVEQIREQASLEGHAGVQGAASGPIVVAVHGGEGGDLVDIFLLPRPGPFFFTLPAGTYRIAAFEDRNRDLILQPGEEPAVAFSQPTDVVLRPGERRTGLDLSIDPTSRAPIPFEVSAASPDTHQIVQFPALQLGTIVDIDDPRFSDANGELGLWDPIRFLFDVGAGVYFLEAYDPDKVPVLFVHGAVGDPGDWKYLVSTLDRSRFQPWFVYYPSAPHLDRLATGVVRAIAALQFKYGFPEMILVAHSMGGLVTRAAINYAMENRHGARVVRMPAFVTLSSPWNGHTAAAAGAKHSPVVAPMWEDMSPGSPFLAQLPRTALPEECEYSLFFSYGGGSMMSKEANDGTVTLSSELSMPIQLQATRVIGFNESHTSILRSPEVAEELNAILARATLPRPRDHP